MHNDRKSEHIRLAFEAQAQAAEPDRRFFYEPMLAAHPAEVDLSVNFLGKTMRAPIWVSSMTGGTGAARDINANIARACREFGLGMGLGSCRKLLSDDSHWADFDLRDLIGHDLPFYANLGIAQVEELLNAGKADAIVTLVERLRADGLIVHVNPLQEWFQPEGNRIKRQPVETIGRLLEQSNLKIIVKEVGQGFGPESLKQLLQLPIEAVEFGAFGGTNFSKLELLRHQPNLMQTFAPFIGVGHTAREMVNFANHLVQKQTELKCRQLIISGGVHSFIDGHFLTSLSQLPSVYGMASPVLKHAAESYESLHEFLEQEIQALKLARTYLKINPDYAG